jgi:hypothetical protein
MQSTLNNGSSRMNLRVRCPVQLPRMKLESFEAEEAVELPEKLAKEEY